MNETLFMILAFIGGLVLGVLFFGGLWLTVKKSVTSKIPALWVFGSFFLRIGITLIGFYYLSLGHWQRLLICVLGFVAARYIVIRFTKSIDEKLFQLKKGANHET